MKIKLEGGREASVFIQHDRAGRGLPGPPGRATHARVVYGGLSSSGAALCAAPDNFCRRTGLRIALRRAMAGAGVPRDDRTLIWEAVFRGRFSRPPTEYGLTKNTIGEAAVELDREVRGQPWFLAVGVDEKASVIFLYISHTPTIGELLPSKYADGWQGFQVKVQEVGQLSVSPGLFV